MSGDGQPPEKNIPLDKTCQDGSVPVIRTETKFEKKVDKLKDNAVTVVLSPHNSPIPSINVAFLLPSSPQIHVVDLGDGGSSERKSTESDEATKKTTEIEKGPKASKLIS